MNLCCARPDADAPSRSYDWQCGALPPREDVIGNFIFTMIGPSCCAAGLRGVDIIQPQERL